MVSSTDVSNQRIGLIWAAAIFAAALAYRGLCFADAGAHPLLRFPVVDAALHDGWAQRIAAGDWLGQVDDVAKPPLYAYFLAGIYATFGRHVAVVQWVQLALGAISAVLIAMIGARLLGRVAGRIAGLLAAFYAPMVFFELQLVTPSLSILLNLAATLALLATMRESGQSPASQQAEKSGRRSQGADARSAGQNASVAHGLRQAVAHDGKRCGSLFFVAGLLLGLSAGVRPDVIVPGGLVAAYVLWQQRRAAWRQLAGSVALLAVGAMLVLAPIAWRNHAITGRFILVSSNAGINFYIGNCHAADGISSVPVGLRWERLVARMPQEVLEDPVAASRWWTDAAWQEINDSPAAFLGGLAKKAVAFFNCREFRNNICYHFFQQFLPLLRHNPLQWAVVFPLAVWGLLRLWCSKTIEQRRAFWICVLWIAGYWTAAVAYFVCARYRLPATPFLLMAAAWGCLEVTRAFGQRGYKSLPSCGVVVLAAGVLCWPAWFGRAEDGWTLDYVNLGNSLREAGDLRGANDAYQHARQCDPRNPDAYHLLGRMAADREPRAAVEFFRSALEILPHSPDVLVDLGETEMALRERTAAVQCFKELIEEATRSNVYPRRRAWVLAHVFLAELNPEASETHWQQAWSIDAQTAAEAAFIRRRQSDRVLQTFEDAAGKRPWDWYAQANYGMILMETGRPGDAAEAFRSASRLSPERPVLRLQLALALFRDGKKAEALQVLNNLEKATSGTFRREIDDLRRRINQGPATRSGRERIARRSEKRRPSSPGVGRKRTDVERPDRDPARQTRGSVDYLSKEEVTDSLSPEREKLFENRNIKVACCNITKCRSR
jgi:cytochrome c-type biogenesis protein CcmH/NrfG/4-amino-4-deoxy-L-arabinose transferase-like glycosyltransferase